MFGFFNGNSAQKEREQRYHSLLHEAMQAQRSGDIRLYSELSEAADLLLKEIEKAEQTQA
ncbi:hypothetical protein SAMN02745866_01361 [Alteromonadaceae bacterium Bs31]|nr:hypothetical protein SAMN02745866_01361 [Alteromonadaceae bacterium Bs31]